MRKINVKLTPFVVIIKSGNAANDEAILAWRAAA